MAQSSVLDYLLMFIFYWLSLFCVNATTYREILEIGQLIGISDTIVSNGGSYELGFFTRSKDNSTKYYVGIWFKKVPNDKIVWVANRDYAFQTTSVVALTINPANGNIVIVDGQITYHVTNLLWGPSVGDCKWQEEYQILSNKLLESSWICLGSMDKQFGNEPDGFSIE
ncbi:S-locus lectin protein kinase family protein [Trifolium repens]|nr:S-locus lectin protein kinase family protein [Trifolium repens]